MSLVSLRGVAPAAASPRPDKGLPCPTDPGFEAVYEENFQFVWRAARRLGIGSGDTDDVVQEVFVVAHRRLPEFQGRAQVKTWLFKILVRVVRARMDSDKREVFVLAEIEELSSVEIAEVIGANVNTVYSRLRAARQEFERALRRFHTHELGGTP